MSKQEARLPEKITEAIAAYGRAESERMGGHVIIAAFMVLEQRILAALDEARDEALGEAAPMSKQEAQHD